MHRSYSEHNRGLLNLQPRYKTYIMCNKPNVNVLFYEAGNHTEFALQAFLTKDDITESKVSKQEPLGTIYLAFIA